MSDVKNEIIISSVVRFSIQNKYACYKVYIPQKIIEYLDLKKGDKVIWEVMENNGKRFAIIRKLER